MAIVANESKFVKSLLDKGILPPNTIDFVLKATPDCVMTLEINTIVTNDIESVDTDELKECVKVYKCPICGGRLIDITNIQEGYRSYMCLGCKLRH